VRDPKDFDSNPPSPKFVGDNDEGEAISEAMLTALYGDGEEDRVIGVSTGEDYHPPGE
jgi:hypothetical protein